MNNNFLQLSDWPTDELSKLIELAIILKKIITENRLPGIKFSDSFSTILLYEPKSHFRWQLLISGLNPLLFNPVKIHGILKPQSVPS